MKHRTDTRRGGHAAGPLRTTGSSVPRRTLGGVLLGGLASVAAGPAARGEAAGTTAEPDGPDHLPRRRVKALDSEISYIELGSAEPVEFPHGNPTWSYQLRSILPPPPPFPPSPPPHFPTTL